MKTDSIDKPITTLDIIVINKNHFTKELTFHLSRKDSSLSIWHTNPPESYDSKQSVISLSYTNQMILLDKAIIDLPEKAELCEVYRVDEIDSGKFLIYNMKQNYGQIRK